MEEGLTTFIHAKHTHTEREREREKGWNTRFIKQTKMK